MTNLNLSNRKVIGKTTATQNIASTVGEYYFWIYDDQTVQPYDFVTAVDSDFYSIGVVLEIYAYTDAMSHLANRLTSDLEPSANIQRLNAKVGQAKVFYSYYKDLLDNEEERMQPVNSGSNVYVSTEDEINKGLNAGRDIEKPLPGGLIARTNGDPVIVNFDEEYILGPQSAHLNISGISGLATKTSYMMFLLYSINKKRPKEYINIIFNVKQADLMNIDKQPESVSEEDLNLYYKIFGDKDIPPFEDVKYYVPRSKGGGFFTYSNRKDLNCYAFSLKDCYYDLDLLFADIPDDYGTVDSFVRYARRDWDERNQRWHIEGDKRYGSFNIGTWRELLDHLSKNSGNIANIYGFMPSTISRIQRNLSRLTVSGIFVEERDSNELYIRDIVSKAQPGNTIVIDIGKLGLLEQGFVVGEVFRELEDIMNSESEENLKKVIVVVDELNSLASKNESSELKHQIIEVARKGRAAHFIIFGAEQFTSEVDEQIVGNSALRIVGRTSSLELQGPALRFLSPPEKNSAMVLRKGELLVSFPTFRSNIKITFPRPPYQAAK